MNREDIIRMAREADPGFDGGPDADGTMLDSIVGIAAVERFAALVRQHTQIEQMPKFEELARLVREDEREACAKVCEHKMPQPVVNWSDAQIVEALRECASAIRARSQA